MGTQYKVGVGYGYLLKESNFFERFPEEVKKKINEEGYGLDEVIEELGYSLITETIGGNLWDGPCNTFIVVKETLVEEYDFVASFKPEGISTEAVNQLQEVFSALNIPLPEEEPQWLVWSYIG